jgi:hypothetical protein
MYQIGRKQVMKNRTLQSMIMKKKGTRKLIDVAISGDGNVIKKES